MSYLFLDLDETTIVTTKNLSSIDKAHTLSSDTYKGSMGTDFFDFRIINPQELAELIEFVCINYDGIIILTAGCWNSNIIKILADNLNLSEQAYKKFISSRFHSAVTDARLLSLDIQIVRMLDKNTRMLFIMNYYPELQRKCFTLLDDNPLHITSCENNFKIQTVLATTSSFEKDFYHQARYAMEICSYLEGIIFDIISKLENTGLNQKRDSQSLAFFNPVNVQNEENPLLAMDVEGLVGLNQNNYYHQILDAMKKYSYIQGIVSDLIAEFENTDIYQKKILKSPAFFNPVNVQNEENPLLAMDIAGLVALNF